MRAALSFFVVLSTPFIGGRAPSVAIAKNAELNLAVLALMTVLSGTVVVLAVIGICRLVRWVKARRTTANVSQRGKLGTWFHNQLPETQSASCRAIWKMVFYPNGLLAVGVMIDQCKLPLRIGVPHAALASAVSLAPVVVLASINKYLIAVYWVHPLVIKLIRYVANRLTQTKVSTPVPA